MKVHLTSLAVFDWVSKHDIRTGMASAEAALLCEATDPRSESTAPPDQRRSEIERHARMMYDRCRSAGLAADGDFAQLWTEFKTAAEAKGYSIPER